MSNSMYFTVRIKWYIQSDHQTLERIKNVSWNHGYIKRCNMLGFFFSKLFFISLVLKQQCPFKKARFPGY